MKRYAGADLLLLVLLINIVPCTPKARNGTSSDQRTEILEIVSQRLYAIAITQYFVEIQDCFFITLLHHAFDITDVYLTHGPFLFSLSIECCGTGACIDARGHVYAERKTQNAKGFCYHNATEGDKKTLLPRHKKPFAKTNLK